MDECSGLAIQAKEGEDRVDAEALHASATFFRGKNTGAKAGKAPIGNEVRWTLASTLLKVLVSDQERYDQVIKEGGEDGYFRSKYPLGQVQYLLWWISAWYPAQVMEKLPGGNEVRISLKGFNRFFEKVIRADDPRLRRQLVLLNTKEHLTCGYFPAKGDFVKVLLVDDFEAPYFLCEDLFNKNKSEPSSSSACSSIFSTPIGKVTKCLPLKDQCEVEVLFLACTETIHVCNTHILPISEDEYKLGMQRIMHSRAQGLSYIENLLCSLGESRLLIRTCATISNQTCLLSFWDCLRHIRVAVFNPGFQRQLSIEIDEVALQKAGLLPCTTWSKDTEEGPLSLAGMAWQEKEVLCDEIIKSLRVLEGELCVVNVQKQQQQQHQKVQHRDKEEQKQLSRSQGKLADVDIIVSFYKSSSSSTLSEQQEDEDEQITIEITHVINSLTQRIYTLAPISAKSWRQTGFVDLTWLRPADRETLCRRLLRHLVPHKGYPALQMHNTLVLPQDFEAFTDETHEQNSETNKVFEVLDHLLDQSEASLSPNLTWKWVCRLPTTQICESTIDVGRKERYLVNARFLGEGGQLEFKAHLANNLHQQQSSLVVRISPSDWHILGFGPLEWYSQVAEQDTFAVRLVQQKQLERLVTLFRDRLEVKNGFLHFNPVYTLRHPVTTNDKGNTEKEMAIQVSDNGTYFQVAVIGQQKNGSWAPILSAARPMTYDISNLEAATGIKGVRDLKWAAQSVRDYIMMRLARLVQVTENGQIEGDITKPAPLLIWKGVQRQIRRGKKGGPLLVSVYDVGYGVQFQFRDFTGTIVRDDDEQNDAAIDTSVLDHHTYQKLLSSSADFDTCERRSRQQKEGTRADIWLLTMPLESKERFLFQLLRHVGHQRVSHFAHFLKLRPTSEAQRIADLVPEPIKTFAIPDAEIIKHIQRLHPDPTALTGNEVKMLKKLLQQVKELNTMIKREDERIQIFDDSLSSTASTTRSLLPLTLSDSSTTGEDSTRSSRSVFRREPKPQPYICECCAQLVPRDANNNGAKQHGQVCSHENRVCRVCMIQRRTSLVLSHMKTMQTRVMETLRRARPASPPNDEDHHGQHKAIISQHHHKEPHPELYSPWNHFYVGTMVLDDGGSTHDYYHATSSSIASESYHRLGEGSIETNTFTIQGKVPDQVDYRRSFEEDSLAGRTTLQSHDSMYGTSHLAVEDNIINNDDSHHHSAPIEIAVIDTNRRRSTFTVPRIRTRLSQDLEMASQYIEHDEDVGHMETASFTSSAVDSAAVATDEQHSYHHQDNASYSHDDDHHHHDEMIEVIDYECNACGCRLDGQIEPWLTCLDCEKFDLCITCARRQGALRHEGTLDVTAGAPLSDRCGHIPAHHVIGWAT